MLGLISQLRALRLSGGSEFKSEQIRHLPQCCFQRLKIVSEFYQETHAILMRQGVSASGGDWATLRKSRAS
jgi:hypothetical protein